MDVSIDDLAAAFSGLRTRPAVFDREIREGVGSWRLAEPVPVGEIVGRFQRHRSFVGEDGRVVLPVHEPDSARLTGEYLEYRPDQLVPCVVYFDYGRARRQRVPFEEFGRSYPAWRLRFWDSAYEPPAAGTASAGTRPAAPGRGADGRGADGSPANVGATGGSDVSADSAAAGEGAATAGASASGPGTSGSADTETPGPDDGPETPGPAAAAASGEDLFEAMRSFLEREREAAREDVRERFDRLGPASYVERFGGVPVLVSAGIEVDEYGQQLVGLRVPAEERPDDEDVDLTADHDVYPGSEVLVGSLEGHEGFPLEAEVLGVDGGRLELGVYWDRSAEWSAAQRTMEEAGDRRFCVAELLNPVPFDRERDAVDAVVESDRKRAVLAGERAPGFEDGLAAPLPSAGLNDHQYEAAQAALRARDVYCIHGPPGTGKTRTLVKLVAAASADDRRVLACAHSNQAADNLLVGGSTEEWTDPKSLHALAEDGDVALARAGDNTDNEVVAARYADADVYQADVVVATLSAAHRFREDLFDLAVVDEATQASIPATLQAYAAAERVVLAGDHEQLPPYRSQETDAEESTEPSLFEHLLALYGEDVSTMLRTQYRMHEAIADFPNRAFYGGRLAHGEENRDRTVGDGLAPFEAIHVAGEERETPSRSYCNHLEARAVSREVSRALHAGVGPRRIGVITPYSGQIGPVRRRIAELDEPQSDAIDVATVDSFQGGERDVIVVSFVRSNSEGHSGFLTFPREGPRRLNVALTRAKRRCVLVGNFDTLRTRPPGRDPGESAADVYQALYEHARDRGALTTFSAGSADGGGAVPSGGSSP